MLNTVELSMDRRRMVIRDDKGRRVILHSRRPNGFTPGEEMVAKTYRFSESIMPGQVNRARRYYWAGWELFVGVNTGPPTFWIPKVDWGRHFSVGWLRVLVAVHIRRETAPPAW